VSESELRYDRMVERALRGVVVEAMAFAATHGLSGEHHFYVTFQTRAAGVKISPALMARYPQEMTIVLQHQFWDLQTDQDGFQVTLSFSGVSERLIVPFSAVTGFSDPSAKFGLQFQVEDDAIFDEDDDDTISGEIAELEPAPFSAPQEELPEGGAQVITLDAFRKK